MSSTKLENTEHIEQLRILENKIIINAVEVNDDGMSVDTHDDLIKIRGEKYHSCFQ
jgi:CMP-2-keto-3-deoxyoctulosonic acid synthetase